MADTLLQKFVSLWEFPDFPPDVFAFLRQQDATDSEDVLAVLLTDQQRRWMTDKPLRVEDYLAGLHELLRLLSSDQPQGASPRFSVISASADTAIQPGASALPLIHARYALRLALSEYTLDEISESQREALLKQLGDWYRDDPSSGVHGAAGWLLRHWEQNEVVRPCSFQTHAPLAQGQRGSYALWPLPTLRRKCRGLATKKHITKPQAGPQPASRRWSPGFKTTKPIYTSQMCHQPDSSTGA